MSKRVRIPRKNKRSDIKIPKGVDPAEYLVELEDSPQTSFGQKERLKKLLNGQYNTTHLKSRDTYAVSEQSLEEKRIIFSMALEGATIHDISVATSIPKPTISKTLRSAQFQKEAAKQRKELTEYLLAEKVPMLKEIVGLSLGSVRDYLIELQDPDKKKELTSRQARDLVSIVKDLNEVLRLELGQSTQNIQVVQYTYDQTKAVLEDLKQIDPVFEYPELPEPENVVP